MKTHPLLFILSALVVLFCTSCSSVPSGNQKVPAPAELLGHWKHQNPYRSFMSGNPFDGSMKLTPNLAEIRESAFETALEFVAPEFNFTGKHVTATISGLVGKPKTYEVYRRPDGDYQITGLGRARIIYLPRERQITVSKYFKAAGYDVPFRMKKSRKIKVTPLFGH